MGKEPKWLDLSHYVSREPVILTLLAGLAIVATLAVAGLSRMYDAQQESLANRWYSRGTADLNAKQFQPAVADFRTALLYSRDNFAYQLDLAEALLGQKRTQEASAYLLNLRDREPENGRVNLDLARIAAQNGEMKEALRYYHNAIYSVWAAGQEPERRKTRLELIELLLRISNKAQAQSELIALAANLGENSAEHVQVGSLFVQAEDYSAALTQYRLALRVDRHNQTALAGAGEAAFELAQYRLAQRYLQAAVDQNADDTASAARLNTTELVLRMDPFRQPLAVAERNRIVMADFAAAGTRLTACGSLTASGTPAGTQQNLAQQWIKLKPQMTERGLRRNPDVTNTAMDLVFAIEQQTGGACGTLNNTDLALLLIAKLHEGN